VAETAAESHHQSSEMAGRHEAALYATLAGHLAKILPVCQTRADFLWAHSRCWLEAQVDKQLAAGQDQDDSDLHAALSAGLDAVGSTRHAQPEEEVHSIVLDDVTAFWPPSRCCSDDRLSNILWFQFGILKSLPPLCCCCSFEQEQVQTRCDTLPLTIPVPGVLADSWRSISEAALVSLSNTALQMWTELLIRSFAADQVDRCTARQL